MKRKTYALFAGLALGSLMAGTAVAQAQPTNPPKALTITNAPAARPTMQGPADFWAQRLGLSDEQKQKVKPIFEEERQKFADLRKLADMKPEDRRTKYMAIREETSAKLKPILTPEQYDKYTKLFAQQGRVNPMTRPASPAPATPPPAAPAK